MVKPFGYLTQAVTVKVGCGGSGWSLIGLLLVLWGRAVVSGDINVGGVGKPSRALGDRAGGHGLCTTNSCDRSLSRKAHSRKLTASWRENEKARGLQLLKRRSASVESTAEQGVGIFYK
ncbi:MAG: hypothetical protein GF344_16450 [Chitinivibrionales bacterium]|nr:hypothetical protein [Chitinivibrionales bacterium]